MLNFLAFVLTQAGSGPITHVQMDRKVAALTFDACPCSNKPGYDSSIIQTLRRTKTPATLFLSGRWIESHQQQARGLAQDPLFELASHGHRHSHMSRLSSSDARSDLLASIKALKGIGSPAPTLFRPPYGEWNPDLVSQAKALGMETIEWSLETGDPDRGQSATRIISVVTKKISPGSVVIFHMNGRGWHTAEALPSLLARLRKDGWRFVKVSELLKAGTQVRARRR